jgi:hypothetical protein
MGGSTIDKDKVMSDLYEDLEDLNADLSVSGWHSLILTSVLMTW